MRGCACSAKPLHPNGARIPLPNRNLRHHAQSVAFGLHRGRQQRRRGCGSGFGRRTRSTRQRRRRFHPLTRAQLRRVRAETHARPQQLRANASEAWQGLVCDHVLTRSVRDSAVLLDIAAQTQARALYACPPPPENGFADSLKLETGRLKIAFWKQTWFGGGNDEGTEAAFAHSLKLMQDAGHELEEATPDFAPPEQLNRAARIIVMGETAKLFYQYQYETGQKLPHCLLEPTTWAMIVQGRQISAGEMAWARDVMLAQERAAKAFFTRYDVLMTPVCPRTTPKIGEMMPPPAAQKAMRLLFGTLRLGFLLKNNPFLEKEAATTLQYVGYTSPLNMSGNPAMSVPLYRHNGLPVGTQFAAAHGREDTLLSLAAQLEQIQPWAEIPQLA